VREARDVNAVRGDRIHSLDALRGLAALTVVFWHWRHFFYEGTTGSYQPQNQPFFDLLLPLYTKGWLAVDLFFALSGFIFYWLYAGRVARGTIAAREFFVLRFSRLYPLHLATLLAVAVGQYAFHHTTGSYFVYAVNDAPHFALHVLFISSWGMERALSFNAPVWSVSVEVLLYGLFFVLCRLVPVRLPILAAISVIGFAMALHLNGALGRGIGSFFLGGCACLVFGQIVNAGRAPVFATWLPLPVAGLWIATMAFGVGVWGDVLARLPQPLAGISGEWLVILVLFPLTILTLAVVETVRPGIGGRFAFLGGLSYASYLLHFPLQLALVSLVNAFSLERSIFYSPVVMAAFFALLIGLSLASHRWFEMPAQRCLRRRLLRC
jgi:peptidoglycan/LPS O-acetylase OafA/YrhL